MTSRPSPPPHDKFSSPSPIKVKDYFTNPLHKIKQPAFTEVGFTVSALNTFVKNFTYRNNSKYINFQQIKSYIKKFTNNNGKLMQMYEDFFIKNFKIKDGLIDGQQFVEFFVKEKKQDDLSAGNLRKIHQDMEPMNVQNLRKKAQHLQVSLSEEEARKIIRMVNFKYGSSGSEISYENFYNAVQQELK